LRSTRLGRLRRAPQTQALVRLDDVVEHRLVRLPFGVVINRVGVGDDRVQRYCANEGIPILLEIPDDRRVAEAYSRGELIVDALPEYRTHFAQLWQAIESHAAQEVAA